jgi:hypothetical protein
MWESIRQTAELDWLRNDAERRLLQLNALDDIDALQKLIDQVTEREGVAPTDWMPLIRARALRGIPADPAGTPYVIDASGRVGLARQSPLFPLPEEPRQIVTITP